MVTQELLGECNGEVVDGVIKVILLYDFNLANLMGYPFEWYVRWGDKCFMHKTTEYISMEEWKRHIVSKILKETGATSVIWKIEERTKKELTRTREFSSV